MTQETINAIEKIVKESGEHYKETQKNYQEMNKKAGWNVAGMECMATITDMQNKIFDVLMKEYSKNFEID